MEVQGLVFIGEEVDVDELVRLMGLGSEELRCKELLA